MANVFPSRTRVGAIAILVIGLCAVLLWMHRMSDLSLPDTPTPSLADVRLPAPPPATPSGTKIGSHAQNFGFPASLTSSGIEWNVPLDGYDDAHAGEVSARGLELLLTSAGGLELGPTASLSLECQDCSVPCFDCETAPRAFSSERPFGVPFGFVGVGRPSSGGEGAGASGSVGSSGAGSGALQRAGIHEEGPNPSNEGGSGGSDDRSRGQGPTPPRGHDDPANDENRDDHGDHGSSGDAGPRHVFVEVQPEGPAGPEVVSVPEPGTLILAGFGVAACALFRRYRAS